MEHHTGVMAPKKHASHRSLLWPFEHRAEHGSALIGDEHSAEVEREQAVMLQTQVSSAFLPTVHIPQ